MKECLNCRKEFEPKKPHGKYCSVNCRVTYNRKLSSAHVLVSPIMQEMFNSIMAGINAINAKNGQPPAVATVIVPDSSRESVWSYNELRDIIQAATSSHELHLAWKAVEKNKGLASWQLKELQKLKDHQQTKIDF